MKATLAADTNYKAASSNLVKFTISKAKNNKGNLKYTFVSAVKGKKSFKAKFAVNKNTGKITVKKGTAKGTYTIKVKVTAKGNTNYKAMTKSVAVTITVK